MRSLYLIATLPRARVVSKIELNADEEILGGSALAGVSLVRDSRPEGQKILLISGRGVVTPILPLNSFLTRVRSALWKEISYNLPDGEPVTSCMLLPENYSPGLRYPAVVDVYPGLPDLCTKDVPQRPYTRDGFVHFNSPYVLSGAGYIVLYPVTPISFIRSKSGPLANISGAVTAAVDAMIAEHLADKDSIGLFGFSEGATPVLTIAARTNRFRAVVAVSGIADFVSDYLSMSVIDAFSPGAIPPTSESVRFETGLSDYGFGTTLWGSEGQFMRNSPIYDAPRISAPVMLVNSDLDAFSMGQFDEMYSALYRLGKKAIYVRYWGEGHGLTTPGNIADFWERTLNWYSTYIPGAKRSSMPQSAP